MNSTIAEKRKTLVDDPTAFLRRMFARTSGGIFICSYANDRGDARKFPPDDRVVDLTDPNAVRQINAFLTANDIPGRACYFGVNTVRRRKRGKEEVAEINCVHLDLDFGGIIESEEVIRAVLAKLKLKPSVVVFSGHGLHVYWFFDKPLGPGQIESHEERLSRFCAILAGDLSAVEVARVLRLPGSHNSKRERDGEGLDVYEVKELSSWKTYSVSELDSWLDHAEPLLTRTAPPEPTPKPSTNSKPPNVYQLFELETRQTCGFDADDRLADMEYKSTRGNGLNDTYFAIVGGMVPQGALLPEILKTLLGPAKIVYERDRRSGDKPWIEKESVDCITEMYWRIVKKDRKKAKLEERSAAQPKTNDNIITSPKAKATKKHDYDEDPPEKKPPWIAPYDFWSVTATEKIRPGMLPEIIENVAFEYAERTGMDVDALATSMLTCCSSVIPTDIKVAAYMAADETFIESIRIWQANVGDSGSGKSPVQTAVTKPLKDIDARLKKVFNEQKADFKRKPKDEQRNEDEPVRQRALLPDVSPESSQIVFAQNPDGLLASYDELVKYFGDKSRHSKSSGGEQSNRGFELASYDSVPFSSVRISRADVDCTPSKSILGGIQPKVLRDLLDEASRNDGLVQRFNPVIMPEELNPRKDIANPKYPLTIYQDLIKDMYENMPMRGTGAILHFSQKAEAVRDRMFTWTTEEMRFHRSANPQLTSHLSKYNGMFVRFCGLFHMIEHYTDKQPRLISIETATKVYKFMTSCRYSHAKAFYGMIRENEENHDMRNIAEYILSHGLEKVSVREIQDGSSRFDKLTTKDIAATASTMVALGWLIHIVGKRVDSFNWLVNPDVHRIFTSRAGMVRARNVEAVRNIAEAKARAEKGGQK